MGTKWGEIVTNHAMQEIDDVRLIESAKQDAAALQAGHQEKYGPEAAKRSVPICGSTLFRPSALSW